MADLVRKSLENPIVRTEALSIVQTVFAQDKQGAVRGIENYARSHVKVIDENDEILIPPDKAVETIRRQAFIWGDCDDASMLVAALLSSIGIAARFKAVWPRADGSFSHVFTEYRFGEGFGWMPLDTTINHAPVYPSDWIAEAI